MGINWDELFSGVKDSVGKVWDDVVQTGVPAIQSAAEKQAIEWLTKQNNATQAVLDSKVQELLERPTDEGTFGSALQKTVQGSFLKNYGVHIAVGLAGTLILGYFIFRK